MTNTMKLEISALSVNESFARSAVAAFALTLNPSLGDLSDIKTAVSEAVTNCVVHAYKTQSEANKIVIECKAEGDKDGFCGVLHIKITDFGCGIDDVEKALTPFFSTNIEDERSGMGFTIMQTFTDGFSIVSEKGKGTTVTMQKRVGADSLVNEALGREKERLNA